MVSYNSNIDFINLMFFISGVHCGPHERRLINDLMDRYQNLERPVFNESEALNLKFGLTLQQIIDVVSKLCIDDLNPVITKYFVGDNSANMQNTSIENICGRKIFDTRSNILFKDITIIRLHFL